MTVGPGRGNKGPTQPVLRRIAIIEALMAQGVTQAEIARRLGISKQRVHQLIHRRDDGTEYLAPYKTRRARERYHELHPEARYYQSRKESE